LQFVLLTLGYSIMTFTTKVMRRRLGKIKTIVRDSKDLFLRHIICQVGKITDSPVMVSQGSG